MKLILLEPGQSEPGKGYNLYLEELNVYQSTQFPMYMFDIVFLVGLYF